MKFSPESLIEIYLNGSFTEEAQVEFDKLMRQDAAFAERVTKAVAERVGPTPDSLERISTNLDSKIDGIWNSHKPAPYGRILKKSVQVAILLVAMGGLYGGFKHYWMSHHATNGVEGLVPSLTDASATHERSSASGGSSKAPTGPSTGSNVKKVLSKKTADELSRDQTSSVDLNGSPASVDMKSSTSPALKTLDDHSTKANPVLNSDKEKGKGSTLTGLTVTPLPVSAMTGSQIEEGDALRVSIETEKKQNVVVTVLDSNGLLVRHLYQGIWNVGIHLVDWDGKDEIGNPVLPGNYTVIVNADGKTMSGTVTVQPNR